MKIIISLSQNNRLYAQCEPQGEEYQYVFQLFRGEQLISKLFATESNYAVFWLTESGKYHVKVSATNKVGNRVVAYSSPVLYEGFHISLNKNQPHESPFQSAKYVLKEILENWQRMLRIAIYDYRIRDKDSYLGKILSVLNPLIQVLTFWFVFGLGLRGGMPIDGYPYLLWMLCGLFPWFFINTGIISGSASIYAKAGTVLRMQYPLATIPLGNILVAFFDHFILIGFVIVIEFCYGYIPQLSWIGILYYCAYTIAFLTALALLTSTLTMVARDFQKLISSLIRFLFYMTPILWSLDSMPAFARTILEMNPAAYIINGYRDSLIYGINFWEHPQKIAFFWSIALALFLLGSWFHRKYRGNFIDFL